MIIKVLETNESQVINHSTEQSRVLCIVLRTTVAQQGKVVKYVEKCQ